ncbi:MAG: hypothetical protein HOP19_00615 [Acidobacteria bacterium]|nr:hypothetical protein [Acidobacteriota bacterium]
MSNQKEEKLNPLTLNKETIQDLDVAQGQDVVGGGLAGAQSDSPKNCIPPPTYLQGRGCDSERPNTCDWKLPAGR